ncbi:type IV pilus biogenesis/stability protein PilW [Azotobacter bryophylli]|uniref:Type IV pilus biogenesis/stability protein PilW n=1 Tax=Azotobacter bryophylli TaxID=1986537 RepID=A0ABV7AUQ0_9GAMM
MITSKEVFAKRKEGAIDEAYKMALELMASPQVDAWDRKAFGWCLIDLIKRDVKNGSTENLPHYRRQLESIEFDPSDDVLTKGICNALSLCNPFGQKISEAKALSKNGRHAEAIAIYRKVWANGDADQEIQTSFGWELYKHAKELMAGENFNLGAVKRNLSDYLKLDLDKPSILHSCVLQLAAKLAGQDKLSMLAFSRQWNFKYLRPEDFERYRAEDGKEYPSLAEKAILHAGKEAASSEKAEEQAYMLLFIDLAIERFPDNVFLKLNKAKVLLSLGRHEEALAFGIAVTKAKSNDYWAWGLLGEIVSQRDRDAALGCYCKALTCPAEDKFTGKIRLKVAQRMLEVNDYAAAKHEIEAILQSKEHEGKKIPVSIAEIASQSWFSNTQAKASNRDYYRTNAKAAEVLLFNDLPWIDANVGDTFIVPGKDGKKDKTKRKVFLKTSSIPTEISIPESKLGRMKLTPGDAVRVKGEFDEDQRFNFFVLESRHTETPWDVFSEKIGVVNNVNEGKQVIRYIVDREVNGEIPMSALPGAFAEGDAIEVRLARYVSKRGPMYRVLLARATDKKPSELLKKTFSEQVRVSNGMGFTPNEIFLPPQLLAKHQIEDDQKVSGTAVLTYNMKRSCWGWKAVSIDQR